MPWRQRMERIAPDDGPKGQRGEFGLGQQPPQGVGAQDGAGEQVAAGMRGFLQYDDAPGIGELARQADGTGQSGRSRADDQRIHLQMGLARLHSGRIAQRAGKTRNETPLKPGIPP